MSAGASGAEPGAAPEPSPEAWREAGATFRFRGHEVFFRDAPARAATEAGRAPPALLLLHGFPTASWDWRRVWEPLRERHRLLAPDFLGFGYSAKPRRHDYRIAEQADLAEALLAERGVPEVALLAHDYGDTVAQELLARHAERAAAGEGGPRLRAVCLLNGGLFPEAHRARPVQRLLASPLGPLLALFLSERRFAGSFAAIFGPRTRPSAEELRATWRLVAGDGGARIAPRLLRYLAERRRHRERWVEALVRAELPIRLVDGPEDPVSGDAMAARYRELVPEPDVVLLPGIGHYPQLEAPRAVVRATRELLARA